MSWPISFYFSKYALKFETHFCRMLLYLNCCAWLHHTWNVTHTLNKIPRALFLHWCWNNFSMLLIWVSASQFVFLCSPLPFCLSECQNVLTRAKQPHDAHKSCAVIMYPFILCNKPIKYCCEAGLIFTTKLSMGNCARLTTQCCVKQSWTDCSLKSHSISTRKEHRHSKEYVYTA